MKTSISTMINGIKLWTRSLVQDAEDKLQSDIENAHTTAINAQTIAENAQAAGKIQSDWAQNDDMAADYVKNRPFYSEYEYEEIIGETITLTGTGLQYNRFLDELMNYNGKGTIRVMWDGVVYTCKYKDLSYNGGYSFGDKNLIDYPFFFYANYGSGYIKGYVGEHTYSLYATTEIVHKLSNKYCDFTGVVRYDEQQELGVLEHAKALTNLGMPFVIYIDIHITNFFENPVVNKIDAPYQIIGRHNTLWNVIVYGEYQNHRCIIVPKITITLSGMDGNNHDYISPCTVIGMPDTSVRFIAHPPRAMDNPSPDYSREVIIDYKDGNTTITVQDVE